MVFETRNNPIGFAQRTQKNLKYIKLAHNSNEDVHVVTHLVNSMLGIVVLPHQHYPDASFWSVTLKDLHDSKGWPEWKFSCDKSKQGKSKTVNLGHLIRHLRNAAAHGRFEFIGEADSRDLSEVSLIVKDAPGKNQKPNWRAEISGPNLYKFCLLLADYIEISIKANDGTKAV